MSKTKFPGIDEFTSQRIRRDMKDRHPHPRTPVGELSLVHEIRSIQAEDPIAVVEEAKGDRATDGEALAAVMYQRALVQSGLSHLGDFHQGMSAPEAESWLLQLGFKRVFQKRKSGSWTHQAWADPITGMVVAGDFGEGRTSVVCFVQFSPDLPGMTEKEEADWNIVVSRLFGGFASMSWFNPKRPHLNHSELHYPRSYPEVADAERLAWSNDFDAMPTEVVKERGQWVMVADSSPDAGLYSLMASLHRRNVRFSNPWEPVPRQEFTFTRIFDCKEDEIEENVQSSPTWFQVICKAALERVLADSAPKAAMFQSRDLGS
jgi:hypothetical protein